MGEKNEPLSQIIRPQRLEDIKGQDHILSADAILRKSIENDMLFSSIFYGPPGSGKHPLERSSVKKQKTNLSIFQRRNFPCPS